MSVHPSYGLSLVKYHVRRRDWKNALESLDETGEVPLITPHGTTSLSDFWRGVIMFFSEDKPAAERYLSDMRELKQYISEPMSKILSEVNFSEEQATEFDEFLNLN